ncbi:MAG TPA: PspC domain-containing protein [Candidatus Sumerlaeota bacterium]|nr:PspC domain-containing protein [Candidatus Sumerlaeota bacterium]
MATNGNTGAGRGLYRSRHGVIAGVCRGVAEHLDLSVFWFRVIVVLVVFFTVTFPIAIVLYVVAALLMKPEPIEPFASGADREFYDSYMSSRPLAIDRLRRTYEALDRRVCRMESIVTSRDFQWRQKLKRGTE